MGSDPLQPQQFSAQEERLRNAKMGQQQLPLNNPNFRMGTEEMENWPHPVGVYRNLQTPKGTVKYSAQDTKSGRVIGHTEDISLEDVTPKINEAGRQRVIREGQKNVHAKVEGTPTPRRMRGGANLTYNPFQNETFVDKDTGAPVTEAKKMRLSSKGGKSTVKYR